MKTYVYLILSKGKLIITHHSISDTDYYLLMNNDGMPNIALACAKTFCIGFILGNGISNTYKVVSSIEEFK